MKTRTTAPPKQKSISMPVILPDTPPGFDWGWYSREDPRIHLQVLDPKRPSDNFKVWLEKHGRRVFEPAAPIKSSVLRTVRTAVARHRQYIEDRWVRFMIHRGWLTAHLAAPYVTLVAYPGTPNSFPRIV